jgi:hypothetical protein
VDGDFGVGDIGDCGVGPVSGDWEEGVETVEEGGWEVDCYVCGVLFCDGGDEEGGAVEVLKGDWECCWVGGVFEPLALLEW